jgi:hypothetical protein
MSRDRATTADYTPLAQLAQRKGTTRSRGAGSTTFVTLVNTKGQEFRIRVSGGSAAVVSRYINETSACVEAFKLSVAEPEELVPVWLSEHLIDAAAAETRKSATALSLLRDSLTSSGNASFAEVIAAAVVLSTTCAALRPRR